MGRDERGVWMGVTWDSSYADAVRALENAGLKVDLISSRGDLRELRIEGAGFRAEMNFVRDRPTSIVLTRESVSHQRAAAIADEMKERWGAPRSTSRTIKWRWDRPDASSVFLDVSGGDYLREEVHRGDAITGEIGFATLSWEMSSADVQSALATAGYDVYVEDDSARVTFADLDDREGEVIFGDEAIGAVNTWGPLTGEDDTRAKELEGALGTPAKHETMNGITWRVDDTNVELLTIEDVLTRRIEVIERYRELDPLLRGHSA